jgi:phosphoribosylformylglycinamidine synthase
MLLIVKRGREAEVERIFEKWDLHAVKIGEVTHGERLRVRHHGAMVADVPNRALADEAPVYSRPLREPANREELQRVPAAALARPETTMGDLLRRLLGAPTVASKSWIYRQYDHMVRTNTVVLPGLGAPVLRVKETGRGIAMSVDGNGRFCLLDPRQGARLAVAEAARNVACAGGLPIGATNCLNFGNPERPDIMWQFAEAVAGLGEACQALEIPVTGGNVSLYNETGGLSILPTPVIGVVGVLDDARRASTRIFQRPDHDVILLGHSFGELGGSEYLKTILGLVRGRPPALDLAGERALQRLLVQLAAHGDIESAHDCTEGGLAVALAECCFEAAGIGVTVDLPAVRPTDGADWLIATLFGESASRVIVSAEPSRTGLVLAAARDAGVPASRIGRTGGAAIRIAIDEDPWIDLPVTDAERVWSGSLRAWLDGQAA